MECLNCHCKKYNQEDGKDFILSDKFCSNGCVKEYFDYTSFYKFFKSLLYKTESCFERDTLRLSKNSLWKSWMYWEGLRIKGLKKLDENKVVVKG